MNDAHIDTELIRRLLQDRKPLNRQEWKQHLRAHQRFVRSCPYRGRWQVLVASGLPLAVWSGPKVEEGKQLHLTMENLTELDLSFAEIPLAALVPVLAEGVCFRGADLSDSVLTDSLLDGADFSIANLESTDFSRASLRGANFRRAILYYTDFQDCDLTGADFTGALMEDVSFLDARLDGTIGLPPSKRPSSEKPET